MVGKKRGARTQFDRKMRPAELDRLAKRIRDARRDAKLTQAQLGARLGITKQTISNWEVGRGEPSVKQLRDIASYTGRDFDWFLGITSPGASGPRVRMGGQFVPKFNLEQISELALGRLERNAVLDRHFTTARVSEEAFAFELFDEAMTGPDRRFAPGKTVVVDRQVLPQPGYCVLVYSMREDKSYFRRYRPHAGSKPGEPPYDLLADNPNWPVITVERRDRFIFLGTLCQISEETHT
ncbi:MAG: helix-turn-helix domain-containing protein [Bacteroidota bacterium]